MKTRRRLVSALASMTLAGLTFAGIHGPLTADAFNSHVAVILPGVSTDPGLIPLAQEHIKAALGLQSNPLERSTELCVNPESLPAYCVSNGNTGQTVATTVAGPSNVSGATTGGDVVSVMNGVNSTGAAPAPSGASASTPSTTGGTDGDWQWTWDNQAQTIQSLMSQMEEDSDGIHYNLHVQPYGGGYDQFDYHYYYLGEYTDCDGCQTYNVWQYVESNTGSSGYSEQPTYLDMDSQVYGAATDFANGGDYAAGIGAETGYTDLAAAATDTSSGSSILFDILMGLFEAA